MLKNILLIVFGAFLTNIGIMFLLRVLLQIAGRLSKNFLSIEVCLFNCVVTVVPGIVITVLMLSNNRSAWVVDYAINANILMLLLSVGFLALITKVIVDHRFVKIAMPITIGGSILLLWFCSDGAFLMWKALGYVLCSIVFIFYHFKHLKQIDPASVVPISLVKFRATSLGVSWFLLVVNVLITVLGSYFVCHGCLAIASVNIILGIGLLLISLSLPAFCMALLMLVNLRAHAMVFWFSSFIIHFMLIGGVFLILNNDYTTWPTETLHRAIVALIMAICAVWFFLLPKLQLSKLAGVILMSYGVLYFGITFAGSINELLAKNINDFTLYYYGFVSFIVLSDFLRVAFAVAETDGQNIEHN